MAVIKPFRALRFNTDVAGDIASLTCPPYDIISEEQRQEYLRKNPRNVIRLELPKEGDDPYAQAGKTLTEWKESNVLSRDEQDGVYLYEEEFTVKGVIKRLKGVICLVKLTPFSEGVVLPHEFTLSKAKTDRFNLMKSTFCNFSQIYSLYMDDGRTRSLIDARSKGAPEQEFTDESGVLHRLWRVTDPDACAALCTQFADRRLYIADGHHRYETAVNFRDYVHENNLGQPGGPADYVMMMLVDMAHEGLVVFPTHRVLRGLSGFDPKTALHACDEFFDVTEDLPLDLMEDRLSEWYDKGGKVFGFYTGGDKWTLLKLKNTAVMDALLPDFSRVSRELDVSVLHTLVLERIFGIDKENMANQKNLSYVKLTSEAIGAVREGSAQCAFLLNPTRVTEIRDVAAANEKMPQKSTYFYPKLITGLVMNELR